MRYRSTIWWALAAFVTMAGCKMTGSSQQSQVSSIGIPESASGQDCLAWKSVLLFTLNALIDQGMRDDLMEQRRSNTDHPDYKNFTKPFPSMDVTEVLSVESTRKLMELIIEKEGGKCHKELLMDSQCMFHHSRGNIMEARFYNDISYIHLNRVLGLSLHRAQLSEYDDFLKRYDSFIGDEAQKTAEGFTHRFYCGEQALKCTREVTYQIAGSLGICLLKKHQKLLKDRNLFDLNDYGYHPLSPSVRIVEDSFQNFIDRSNQLSQRP